MKPSQAFGVAVRIIGLLLSLTSLLYIASAVFVWAFPNSRPNVSPPLHYALYGLFLFLAGWVLLRRADRIVSFTYRHNDSDETDA